MRETLLLLIFAGQSKAQQGKCAACVGRMDHTGAIQGNPACFEDLEEDDNRVDWVGCPVLIGAIDPVCESSAITHWAPDGKQTLTVHRRCREVPHGSEEHNESFCLDEVISSQTGEHWRSCTSFCDAREEYQYECNRNTMLSTINLHNSASSGDEISCLTCSGSDCESGGASENCPNWANHGCFSATGFKINEENTEFEKTSMNRGCSSFSNVDKCHEIEKNSDLCRQTCSDSDCNSNDLRPLSRCHVCEALLDPFSDQPENCLNSTDENLVTCAFEEQFCATKLTAEWTKRGNQIHKLARGCSQHPSPEEMTVEANCISSSVNNELTKDCRISCESYGCNSGDDIFDLFNDGTVSSCMTCNNTDECLEGISGYSECPEYASSGCYVGTNWKGEDEFKIYRHCSSFEEPRTEECDPGILDASRHTLCKSSCGDNDCNDAAAEYPAPVRAIGDGQTRGVAARAA